MPVPSINRAVVQAVNVARSIAPTSAPSSSARTPGSRRCASGGSAGPDVPLDIVETPYRALAGPLMAYLDLLDQAWPPDKPEPITFVIVPEFVARHWWERMLYNQSAQPAPVAAPRAAAHGGRRHAVPARRPGRGRHGPGERPSPSRCLSPRPDRASGQTKGRCGRSRTGPSPRCGRRRQAVPLAGCGGALADSAAGFLAHGVPSIGSR